MKLAALYNVFDSEEHLEFSINQIRSHVEVVIALVQDVSNTGNYYRGGVREVGRLAEEGLIDKVVMHNPNPAVTNDPQQRELIKRNRGLEAARESGCTHFISIDCDEFYYGNQFENHKNYIESNGIEATACYMHTYWASPTLKLQRLDNYYVPFICKLKDDTQLIHPLQGDVFGVHCDPTRIPNLHCKELFNPLEIAMHHMSWVRRSMASFNRKIDNSTSPHIREVSMRRSILSNLINARPGLYLPNYEQELIECPNDFNIHYCDDWEHRE